MQSNNSQTRTKKGTMGTNTQTRQIQKLANLNLSYKNFAKFLKFGF